MAPTKTVYKFSRFSTGALLLGLSFLLVALTSAIASPYWMRVIIVLGINIILVVSLNLSNGFSGVFSLGHVGFMAIGAYVSSILTLSVPAKAANLPDLPGWLAGVQLGFLPSLLVAGALAALVAWLIGIPLMRLSGHYVAVATMGFLVIVHVVLINWTQFTRGARTFSGVTQYTNLWWVYGFLVFTIYIVWRIVRSPYGRALIAVRENEIAAQAVGVNVLRSRLLAYVISAFLTAVGGGLMAHHLTSFSPASFYFVTTFNIIIMLVLGGMGSISGSVLGTLAVTLLSEILRFPEIGISIGSLRIPPIYGLSQIILAVAFVLVVTFRRKGLMGDREIDIQVLLSKWISSESK